MIREYRRKARQRVEAYIGWDRLRPQALRAPHYQWLARREWRAALIIEIEQAFEQRYGDTHDKPDTP